MKLIICILFIAAASAQPRNCRGIFFNNKLFEPEIIKEGINKIQKLVLNRNDNTLYFIFDNLALVPNKALGYIHLDTKTIGLVNGIRNASSVAIDQMNNVVYAGGPDGLYIVNSKKVPERLPVFDNINDLFFKDILYFTNRRLEAFKVVNNIVYRMLELQGVEVNKIIINDDNILFFTVNKKLFSVQLGTRAVNTHERVIVDALSVDNYLKPFITTTQGVYAYNKYKYVFDKVSDIKGLSALTFNKHDDPIYGVVDVIIKLNINENACYDFQNLM